MLAEAAGYLDPDDPLWIGKTALSNLRQCEGYWKVDPPFEWSIAAAVGQIADRAIERSIMAPGRDRSPLEWVDTAIELELRDERSIGGFVASLPVDDRDELRFQAANHVTTFLTDWAPIDPRWRPRLKPSLRASLLGGRIVLSGRPDLVIGRPVGTTAGVAIVDIKSGSWHASHQAEVRFYAVLEALARGVPPYLIGSYYTATGELLADEVDEAGMTSATNEIARLVYRMFEIRFKNVSPILSGGPACRWCPISGTCGVGQAWIEAHP